MKNILLLATTILAVIPPAFGMQEEPEENAVTIKIIANLDVRKSPRMSANAHDPGKFLSAPKNSTYNFGEHSISFDMILNEVKKRPTFKFSVKYISEGSRRMAVETFHEVNYECTFGCQLPDNQDSLVLHATLLSVIENAFGYRMRTQGACYVALREPVPTVRYEIENIGNWEGVPVL